MFTTDIVRTVAAIACTIVFSATAIVSAVGPAATPQANTTVAATARLTA